MRLSPTTHGDGHADDEPGAAARGRPDRLVVAAAVDALPADATVVAPDRGVAAALHDAGVRTEHADFAGRRGLDAVALLADELDATEPEGLLAAVADALRPGGLLAVSAGNGVHRLALAGPGVTADAGHRDDELVRLLGHRGFAVEHLTAPGAAAALRGDPGAGYDHDLDRLPSLLGAGPRLVAVGRLGRDAATRSGHYFATLPRKVIAACVVCRDAGGRLLVAHDAFRRHWTIPGGVVDADEDPRDGAVREAEEETGVRVALGGLLGVFTGTWPDRIVFAYAATPVADDPLRPHHPHEVDDARWLPLDEALDLLPTSVRVRVERCLREPGGSWRE